MLILLLVDYQGKIVGVRMDGLMMDLMGNVYSVVANVGIVWIELINVPLVVMLIEQMMKIVTVNLDLSKIYQQRFVIDVILNVLLVVDLWEIVSIVMILEIEPMMALVPVCLDYGIMEKKAARFVNLNAKLVRMEVRV